MAELVMVMAEMAMVEMAMATDGGDACVEIKEQINTTLLVSFAFFSLELRL